VVVVQEVVELKAGDASVIDSLAPKPVKERSWGTPCSGKPKLL
jgi:hypothetical protein